MVARWLAKLGVPDSDLPDLTQAVFEQAIRGFSTYDPERARPERWLNRIAVHVASHYFDRAHRRYEVIVDPAELNVIGDDDASILEGMVTEEDRRLLREVIRRLPDHLAWILIEHDLHGCSMQALATSRGIPLSTAYKWRARAFAAAQSIARELRAEAERIDGAAVHGEG